MEIIITGDQHKIVASEGMELAGAVFTDNTTGLLIVRETPLFTQPGTNSKPGYVTTIDPGTMQVISIADRVKYIDYTIIEKPSVLVDGLKMIIERTVNVETGSELIKQQLIKTSSGEVLLTMSSIAFREDAAKPIDEEYILLQQQKAQEELFWSDNYAHFTNEQKALFWMRRTHQSMKWQSESTGDAYSVFNHTWYTWAVSKEPAFDAIFEEAITRLGYAFDWEEYWRRVRE